MNARAGNTRLPRCPSLGFSLVELLLAVALLALLFGAVAFNFSAVQEGAELDEGAQQLESLLRYARAHAANSGRKVRISFEEDVGDGLTAPLGNLAVHWEPDPLTQPGFFQTLPETADYVRSILDSISIEVVRPGNSSDPAIAPDSLTSSIASDSPVSTDSPDPAATYAFPPITFYPDGSSDSAEITIALRNDPDNPRRLQIQLVGLTGAIRRRQFTDPALSSALATEPDPGQPTAETGPTANKEVE